MRDKTPGRARLLAGAIAVAAVGFLPAVAHADDSAASAVSDAGGA